jgi:hypothetical protein
VPPCEVREGTVKRRDGARTLGHATVKGAGQRRRHWTALLDALESLTPALGPFQITNKNSILVTIR